MIQLGPQFHFIFVHGWISQIHLGSILITNERVPIRKIDKLTFREEWKKVSNQKCGIRNGHFNN